MYIILKKKSHTHTSIIIIIIYKKTFGKYSRVVRIILINYNISTILYFIDIVYMRTINNVVRTNIIFYYTSIRIIIIIIIIIL